MQELIYCLVIVLTVLAIICIVKMLINTFLYKKGQLLCVFTIIPVTENKKDIEYTVRSLLWEKRWDEKTEQFIILVIINCDNETIQICKKLCEEYEPVCMCRPEQLEDIIKNPQKAIKCLYV